MKASGPRIERETVILFNDDEDTAEVFTLSDVVYNKLRKRGYEPKHDDERSAVFVMEKSKVSILRAGKSKRGGNGGNFKKKITEQILPAPQENI